jgi:pimeloyl-ACP methyl ester carboxylesterase
MIQKMFNYMLLLVLVYSCQKEKISLSTQAQDLFYVENADAKMAVLVEGNTLSKVLVLIVHGGPGGTAIGFQNDKYISSTLESNYAVAYWEQRGAGISQGNGKLEFDLYVQDMKKVIAVLKHCYGSTIKVFIMSHSWGGLVAPGYLTDNTNQTEVSGWINVAGAHNYYLNDSLTRDYLLRYGKEQLAFGNRVKDWQKIVNYAEANIPNYNYKMSSTYAACASTAEGYINDIYSNNISLSDFFISKYPFSLSWAASNAGATYLSNLGDEIMHKEFSSKLHLLTLPILCITGKYDFTCPKALAQEVMTKVNSVKRKMVILEHSGHICMQNEPDAFYAEVMNFIKENK